jgi:hypothetical protein
MADNGVKALIARDVVLGPAAAVIGCILRGHTAIDNASRS